ncbi:hypothetical protein [Nocardioides sp. SYSU D00038]|uniref:hypothetical protein n=1 Tax=Nocardioides sp. SYSU D00038 TaxID=2812554 RepID=UPI0019682E65|nr:hypothetical protein [Nocardioides sp. SYSU D00038]
MAGSTGGYRPVVAEQEVAPVRRGRSIRRSGRPAERVLAVGAALVLAVVLTGCGQDDAPAARRTVHFYAALAADDGAAACADLAPGARQQVEDQQGAPCAEAILELGLQAVAGPVSEVEVYGSAAQAVVGDDTAFLSRYAAGWLITAVGCTPGGGDRPYTCAVEVS